MGIAVHGDMYSAEMHSQPWRHGTSMETCSEDERHSCHENHMEMWVLQYTEKCRERTEMFIYHMETWDQHGDMQ